MKANEFVKNFGWEEAKNKVDDCDFLNAESFNFMGVNVAASDLKRLVDSWELVEKFGGLETSKYLSNIGNLEDVKQAIADVESCQ